MLLPAKAAFIGTEAFGTAFMHIAKLATYQNLATINGEIWLTGLAFSPVMFFGTALGKRFMDRIPSHMFVLMLDLLVVGFGFRFLFE